MDRGLGSSFLTELVSDQNSPIYLVTVETSGGDLFLSNACKTLTVDIGDGPNNYIGVGSFLDFSDIEETNTLQISNVTVSLSGVDQTIMAVFLLYEYIDRPLKIHLALLNSSGSIIDEPLLIFDGRMNNPSIMENPESGTCLVSVEASNQFIDWERRQFRMCNNENQKKYFPNDKGFQYTSTLPNKEIFWGKNPPAGVKKKK